MWSDGEQASAPAPGGIGGWASVVEIDGKPMVDGQGHTIAVDELREDAHDFTRRHRVGKLDHRGPAVFDVVESIVVDAHTAVAMGCRRPAADGGSAVLSATMARGGGRAVRPEHRRIGGD